VLWFATEGASRASRMALDELEPCHGPRCDYEIVKGDIQYKSDPSKVSQHHAKQKEEMGLQSVDVAYNPTTSCPLRWTATASCGRYVGGGLARFDGTKFTNFTVAMACLATMSSCCTSTGRGACGSAPTTDSRGGCRTESSP